MNIGKLWSASTPTKGLLVSRNSSMLEECMSRPVAPTQLGSIARKRIRPSKVASLNLVNCLLEETSNMIGTLYMLVLILQIWSNAVKGELMSIPASVRVQSYRTLKTIAQDSSKAIGMERQCSLYVGSTGTGKTHTANEQYPDAYFKDPCTKWWEGYEGESAVIVDEFRGQIGISHILRWTDKYKVRVEKKGGSTPLLANRFIFTSNLPIEDWYPDLDSQTLDALKRRITVVVFKELNKNDLS